MFGQNNQQVSDNSQTNQMPVAVNPVNAPDAPEQLTPAPGEVAMPTMNTTAVSTAAPQVQGAPALDINSTMNYGSDPSLANPLDSSITTTFPGITPEIITPAATTTIDDTSQASMITKNESTLALDAATPGPVDAGLLSIKQEALEKLSPLIGQLDQSPEEKFHTTMMMIQASDNQELVKDAYEAAQKITDEKEKALFECFVRSGLF
jgi:hypothetical protein